MVCDDQFRPWPLLGSNLMSDRRRQRPGFLNPEEPRQPCQADQTERDPVSARGINGTIRSLISEAIYNHEEL